MRHHCVSSSDRISELPCNIIGTILTFLPLRETARTSILSRNWRFHWTSVPHLIFDDNEESRAPKTKNRYTMGNIFEILLLHQGMISKFSLNAVNWPKSNIIDKVIIFLSRNGIQDLTLRMRDRECQRLASSIFSCLELKHLSLRACIFQPLTLVGFKNLVSAELLHVVLDPVVSIPCGTSLESLKLIIYSKIDYFSVNGPNLKSLFFEGSIFDACEIFAPLKTLSLTGNDKGFLTDGIFDIIQLLRSLHLLENLHLSHKFRQLLGDMLLDENSLAGFATMLRNLRVLELIELDLDVYGQAPSVLWLMESSPSLEKIIIQLNQNTYDESCETDYNVGNCFTSVREIEVSLNYNSKPMFGSEFFNFLKFLLAVTPSLETLYIKLIYDIDVDGYKSLLALASLPRASPKAKLVYPGIK